MLLFIAEVDCIDYIRLKFISAVNVRMSMSISLDWLRDNDPYGFLTF